MNIKPETYYELSKHKNIVAVKEASSDVSDSMNSMALCLNKLSFYTGNDDLIVPMMSYGAKGVISVVSNIIPSVLHEITKLCLNGNFKAATALHQSHLKLINAMFSDVNPIPVKHAAERIFGINSDVRLPLNRLSSGKAELMDKLLVEYGLI